MHKRLPHWYKDNAAYFLTWRLYGSRPADDSSMGPQWLAQPQVARILIDILCSGVEYELGAWVLMPNHIHLILRPFGDLGKTVNLIKGRTASAANQYLHRKGNRFWEKDYFDHWIRDRHEEERIVRYIESNPVRAGLCGSPEEWPWSSLWTRLQAR